MILRRGEVGVVEENNPATQQRDAGRHGHSDRAPGGDFFCLRNGEEAMEQRISLITLGVHDLERSREFYERLGWIRSMKEAEGVVFFQAGGMVLSLYPRGDLARDANLAAEGSGFCGMSLAYNARSRGEVDAVIAEAQAAGGKILKVAEEAFWGGYSGYFSDPDGFPWEVAWNPSFAIAADGSIQLPQ
jgi:catechol 2,3-dioxygenase-like lactoylglutathione lyase family enzyme